MQNEILFRQLQHKFGTVLLANAGVANEWRTTTRNGKLTREIVVHGEQLRVACPWCGETRNRLYFNYEWATVDPITGDNRLWLVRCMNEDCLQTYPHRRGIMFSEILFGKPVLRQNIRPGIQRQPGVYVSPGATVPLTDLDPTHPAIQYLADRNFCVKTLSLVYKVSWCESSPREIGAQNRIIIPAFSDGKEVGWSGRILPSDSVTKAKYRHMPGFQTSRHLYNFDTAKRYKTVIIVEGMLDCIRVGPPAVAVLGRSISTHNVDRLVSVASRNDIQIVVALDPDISKTDKQSRHHIEVAVSKIKHHYSKVMPLYLTSGSDPASLTRQEFRRLLYESAAAQNVTLDFSLTKER